LAEKSKAAIAAFRLGIATLVCWGLAVVVGYTNPPPPGHASPALGEAGASFVILMLMASILGIVTLLIAIWAIISIVRSKGKLEGIKYALIGLACAASPEILVQFMPRP